MGRAAVCRAPSHPRARARAARPQARPRADPAADPPRTRATRRGGKRRLAPARARPSSRRTPSQGRPSGMTVRARRPRLAKSAAQLGVLVVVGLASALAIVYFAKAMSQLDEVATTNSRLSLADRAIAGGNSIIVDQQAAYEARALIPRSESYRVVTGSPVKDATSLTATFVGTWFRYFLMPRRPADEARW